MKAFIYLSLLLSISFNVCAQTNADSAVLQKLNQMNQNLLREKNVAKKTEPISTNRDSLSQKDSPISVKEGAQIEFEYDLFDAGNIVQGMLLRHTFVFTNTGNVDLEVYNVVPDCSCTSPQWTDEKIPPGGNGKILVSYDSKDDLGKFLKTITVLHNAGIGHSFIELKGFVEAKL